MKFKLVNRLLDEELLFEDIAAVKKNYPNIPDDKFMQLIKLDPTYIQGRDSVGTYGKWILNLFNKGKLDNEGHVKDVLTRFEDNKKYLLNKDINTFKSLEDLDNYLNNDDNYKQKSHSQEVRDRQKDRKNADLDKEATKVFSGDGFDVWVPHTYAASCKLGQGSKWCTATTENDYYYNYYKEEYGGDYYILIKQSNPEEKYQFHFESGQFMDKIDYSIDVNSFLRDKKELKEFFIPKVEKALGIENMKSDDVITVVFENKYLESLNDGYKSRSDNFSSRRDGDCDLNTCIEILEEPYEIFHEFDYSIGYSDASMYVPKFSDDVRDKLTSLGIDPDNFVSSVEEMEEDNPDLAEDIKNAYAGAYSDGDYWGRVYEAQKDIEDAFKESHASWDGSDLTFKFTKDEIINTYFESGSYDYSDPYFSDKKEELALVSLCKNFKVTEPYYGWYGFSEEEFNWRFDENLYELT